MATALPTPSGSGDVWGNQLNTWLNTSNAVFNVKLDPYNAVGDGVTNDQAAIQAALTAAGTAGGGIVVLPRATYLVNSQLTIPSFVTLMGMGLPPRAAEYGINNSTASTIKCGASAAFDVITNSNSSTGNTSIGLVNLQVDCSNMTGDNRALNFNKVRRSLVDNVYFRGAATTSRVLFLYQNASEHNLIRNCFFEGGGISIPIGGTSPNRMVLDTCEIAAAGVSIQNGFDHIIRNCDIYMTSIGTPYPWASGIFLANTTGAQILGNQLTNCINDGLAISSACIGTVVVGNQCKGNSTQTAGTWGGMLIDSTVGASVNNVIVGNRCWDPAGAGGTQGYGLRISSNGGAGLTADNLIEGNAFKGNRTAGVNLGANLGVNTIRNNYGWNPQGHSVTQPAVPASTTPITNTTSSDCTVHIVGGTVSAIAVGGTATGLTATPATVRVPSGQTITLTYTVAPTWQWFGD